MELSGVTRREKTCRAFGGLGVESPPDTDRIGP
jgi:hypothetical protein